jgi:hypothetical protein
VLCRAVQRKEDNEIYGAVLLPKKHKAVCYSLWHILLVATIDVSRAGGVLFCLTLVWEDKENMHTRQGRNERDAQRTRKKVDTNLSTKTTFGKWCTINAHRGLGGMSYPSVGASTIEISIANSGLRS